MIDFSKVLFFVDGKTEIESLKRKIQKEFSTTPKFNKVDCNGKDVSPRGYANKISPLLVVAFGGACVYYICILDLEKRKISKDAFATQIKNAIRKKLAGTALVRSENFLKNLLICVADRMFENWVIADVEGIKKRKNLINQSMKQLNYEGKHGVSILKQNMKVRYSKIEHCSLLFKAIRFNQAKKHSCSFRDFIKILDL